MTQKTTLPTSFAGPLAANLPKFVPSAPVTSGLIRRFTTSTLDASQVGAAIASLPDSTGFGSAFAQATEARRPTLRLASGVRYLEFDGLDDAMMAGSAGPQGIYSIAVLARYRANAASPAGNNWPVFALGSSGAGAYSLGPAGVMASYVSAATVGGGSPGNGWHVFQAVFNGANSSVRMDAVDVTGNTGNLPIPANMHAGMGVQANTYIPIDVAEILIWNKALSAAERDKVAHELKALHGI